MGSFISSHMDEMMNKQQKSMNDMQTLTVGRQVAMQDYMREQGMAMQIARARDMFHFYAAFYGTAVLGVTAAVVKSKKPQALGILVPLTFVFAYQGDMAYGDKMDRIRSDAQKILAEQPHLIKLPTGPPTLETIDNRREENSKRQ